VDPRVGLDDVEKRKFLSLPGLKLRPLSPPARSQSLYRIRYPASYATTKASIHNYVKFIFMFLISLLECKTHLFKATDHA
jgi:hypothetical protein